MRPSDPDYVAELKRELQLNMQPCRCSHCDPIGSERIFNYLRYLKESDFNQAVLHGIPEDIDVPPALSLNREATRKGRGQAGQCVGDQPRLCPPKDPVRQFTGLQGLALCLRKSFDRLFEEAFFIHSDLETTDLFNDDQAWLVCKNYESLLTDLHLDSILGSEPLVGAYQAILGCIEHWKGTESHQSYLSSLIAMQSRARDVQLEAFEKEAQKIEKAKRRKAEALAKEERELVRLEKKRQRGFLTSQKKNGDASGGKNRHWCSNDSKQNITRTQNR